jgi:SAM-dependent methyltransferase
MTAAALLEMSGAPLAPAGTAPLAGAERRRLYATEAAFGPVDRGDVILVGAAEGLGAGDTVVAVKGDAVRLALLVRRADPAWRVRWAAGEGEISPAAILGRVVAVEKNDVVVDLRTRRARLLGRLLARLPAAAGRRLRAAAELERLRRPLFPPLYLGSEAELLAGLRRAYDPEAPVWAVGDGLDADEAALLAHHLAPGMRLLDVGCGAGREAVALARAGLAVTAVDLAPAMAALTRRRAAAAGLPVAVLAGDALELEWAPASFDAVYLAAGVYSHIPGRARRVATLARLRERLRPGGLLALVPLFHGSRGVLSRSRLVDGLRRLGRAAGVRRLSEPGDGFQRGHGLVPPPDCFRYVHHFASAGEVEAELAAAGLALMDRPGSGAIWVTRGRDGAEGPSPPPPGGWGGGWGRGGLGGGGRSH